MPWPTPGLRRASINSFGFGGANAHIVLDDAYNYLLLRKLQGRHITVTNPLAAGSRDMFTNGDLHDDRAKLLVWSAADENGLDRLCSVYQQYLNTPGAEQIGKNFLPNVA